MEEIHTYYGDFHQQNLHDFSDEMAQFRGIIAAKNTYADKYHDMPLQRQ